MLPEQWLELRLEQLAYKRTLHTFDPDKHDFYSNDYLGLARIPMENTSLLSRYFSGSTGSRLISGHHEITEYFESQLSHLFDGLSVLSFSSGYMANLALVSSLSTRNTTFLYDEHIHASIREALRLGFGKAHSFRHNQMEDLEKKLKKQQGQVFIVTESLFSMDGDSPDFSALKEITHRYNAGLILDEAHAFGLYGTHLRGLAEAHTIEEAVFARVITFGKAMGRMGAAVVGSPLLREYLINYARPFIFTTALSPVMYAYLTDGLQKLIQANDQRNQLQENISFFMRISPSSTPSSPIQTFHAPPSVLFEKEKKLRTAGYSVKAIMPPTVKTGHERIRIVLHAFNTKNEIRQLLNTLYN